MSIKRKAAGKILSSFLALTLLLGMIPVGALASSKTHPDVFTVTVTDEKGAEVEDVSVTITPVDDIGIPIFSEVTGSDGVAEFQEITDYFSDEGVEFQATYEATKEGYDRTVCDENVTISESDGNLDVTIITTQAPEITDVTGNPDEWVKEATLTVIATDNDDPENLKYRVNGGTEQDNADFIITENGTYKFEAIDKGKNISKIWEVVVEKIDNKAPQNISLLVNPESWTKDDITVTVSAVDNESGLDDEPYSIDNENWQLDPEFIVKANGEYTFYVKDRVGNIAQSEPTHITNKDTEIPVIDSITIKYNDTQIDENTYISTKETYAFTVNASDIGSGVAAFSTDGTDWKEAAEGETSYTFSLQGAEEYTFYVRDAVGNESEKVLKMNIDENAPIVTVEPSTTAPTAQISYTVKAEEPEEESGLNAFAYKLDENDWTSVNEFEITDRNEHTIYVQDNAVPANIYSATFRATNLNLSNPSITEIKLSSSKWTNETVKFELISEIVEYQDEDGTYSFPIADYEVDGEWQEFTDANITNIFEFDDCKEHTFRVKDTSGKCSDYFTIAATNYDAVTPTLIDGEAITFDQQNESWFANLLNKLSFGRFFNERLVITVNAKDVPSDESNASGIVSAIFEFVDVDGATYTFDANEIGSEASENETTIQFVVKGEELPRNFNGYANVILEDAAGNSDTIKVTTANSNMGNIPDDSEFYFMIENTQPTVDSITPSETSVEGIYKEDYSVDFKFSDKDGVNNSGIGMVKIDVNGTEVLLEDYQEETAPESIVISTNAVNKTVNNVLVENWNNGELEYSVSVVDRAGNVSETKTVTYCFDQTAPEIIGFEFSKADDGYYKDGHSFDKVYEAVTAIDYGFYFKNTVEVTVTAKDIQNESEAISAGVKSITVYLEDTDSQKLYTVKSDGDEISEISDLSEIETVNTNDKLSFVVPRDFKGQIYAFATDNVNNSPKSCRFITDNDVNDNGFVTPDGSIIETADKHTNTSSIEFIQIPNAQGTQNNSSGYAYKGNAQADEKMDYVKNIGNDKVPLYNTDITFGVKVSDSYSGIREVSFTIIEGPKTTVRTVQIDNEGNFVDENAAGWVISESTKDTNLVTEMTNNISVSGNYNDMVLLLELTDRAGNKSYDYYVFGIDKTAPLITVTYNNNSSNTQSNTGDYFKANRIATVVVKERNFNTENVKFTIKNAEGQAPKVVDKGQTKVDKIGNGDENEYTYTITYKEDGVYSFAVAYTDRATNKANVDTKDSVAPYGFILDKTMPTISVSYDNNEAQNEKYFKANRTATITIVEHNFDVNRVIITQTSALSGSSIPSPSVSWVNNGDTHTGTIHYNNDGDYTFNITMDDKAGNKETGVNYGNSVAPKEFTVDTTYLDIVKVDGIADQGILGLNDGKVEENATVTITVNDVNLDNYNIQLTRSRVLVEGESYNKKDAEKENVKDNPSVQCAENNVDVTAEFVKNSSGNSNAIATISIPKENEDRVRNDGLYTLTIEAKDKAGNIYDTNSNIITFSVNRFGSVFTFSNDLYNLITDNDGYTKKVTSSNLNIYEYNTTSVNSESIDVLLDGSILDTGTDYTFSKDTKQTDTSWNKYTYNIKPENFAKDGEYIIRISSEDAASISSKTELKPICKAKFTVDSTPAEIETINYSTDIKEYPDRKDKYYAKTDNLKISFSVYDDYRIEKIEVFVNDMENSKFTYQYGKDFSDPGRFKPEPIVLEESQNYQSFKIVVTDKAGNVIDTSKGDSNGNAFKPGGYEFFDHDIVVTPNVIDILVKSPIFWGTIGGVAIAAIGITILIVLKKRKKNEKTPNEN